MTICRKERFLVVFLLCILFCTDLHANRPPRMNGSSDRGTEWLPNLPPQCKVSKSAQGLSLKCNELPFSELLQTSRAFGKELVALRVASCWPILPVSLNASCFSNNTNLTDLRLRNCGVMDVAAGTFVVLRHLNLLNLGLNMISTVTTEMLAGLGHLKVLMIADNNISDLKTKQFANMGNLTHLYVERNRIVKIEQGAVYGLSELKKLYLRSNLIYQIDQNAFSGLQKLKFLGLSNNKMKFLQKGMLKTIENLTSLYLDGNPDLDFKEYDFRDLRALEKLSLASRTWSFFTAGRMVFAGLRKLKYIGLQSNWPYLASLEETDLSVIFKDQRETLRHLDLRGTCLNNRLLEMTRNLTQLEWLGLGNNDLLYIKQYSLPTLARNGTLKLNNNKISYIDERAFEGMQNKSVWLERNPLTCSCKHKSFSRWLRSVKGAVVADRELIFCGGPIDVSETRVMDYDPYWWQCSEYMPLLALISSVGFVLIVALISLIGYCNRINLKHWLLERRVASMPTDQDPEPPTESGPLLNPALCRNSLRQGKTGAYIIHDIYERHLLDWVNKYLEDQFFNHPMKITLQFPAGPEVIPLWKQVKDFSVQVNAFLVLVTDQFLANHWPEIAEKSGVDNIMKCVFVLHGIKKSDLPKEMRKLPCPCFQWPETGTRFTTLERERDQFWKEVRIAVKVAE